MSEDHAEVQHGNLCFDLLGLCVGTDFVSTLFRFVVIDLSAGPCTYGKIETEEGSVSARTLPRLQNVMVTSGLAMITDHITPDIFTGQLASLISTTVEHVIAPDARYLFYFMSFFPFFFGCLFTA